MSFCFCYLKSFQVTQLTELQRVLRCCSCVQDFPFHIVLFSFFMQFPYKISKFCAISWLNDLNIIGKRCLMFVVSPFKASASRADILLFDVISCYRGPVNDIFCLALTFYGAGVGFSAIAFKSGWSLLSNSFLL